MKGNKEMNNELRINTPKLLEIIGSKEVENNLLRNRILQLEQELSGYKDKKESVALKTKPVE